jgi:tetratricopeptide (TPR) repeat protein
MTAKRALLLAAALALPAAGCAPSRPRSQRDHGVRGGGGGLSAALFSAPEVRDLREVYPREIDPRRTSTNPTWGYTKDNPIKVGGPRGTSGPISQRMYLQHLRDSNFLAMRYRRLGSVGPGPDGHVVDLYELTGADGRTYRLYMDMYHPEINPLDLVAPAGLFFHLRPGARAPLAPGAELVARLPRAERPVREAETQYRLALALWRELGGRSNLRNRQRKYLDYVMASQRHLLALVSYAEGLEAETSRRRAYARGAAATIRNWLAVQREKGYADPPPAVLIWMYYHLGRALTAAGDVPRACREGYDRVLKFPPDSFPTKATRDWAWQMRLTAGYVKARALADAARAPRAWERALSAAGCELVTSPRTQGRALRVRARILRVRCLIALGRNADAVAEYQRGRADAGRLTGAEAKEVRSLTWNLITAVGPDRVPAEHTSLLASPEVMVSTGLSLYRQKRYDDAAKVWRAVVVAGAKLPFARRCSLGGEPRAWFYLGVVYYRQQKYVRAQEAWESALVEFWQKMPASFKTDPKNRRLIRDLKEILESCARNGRIAAAARFAKTRSKEDLARLKRWMDWQKQLRGETEKEEKK